jgi:branched-subunit amino acid aminotransferase/4-amino-4-deoxychorismate lyase
VLHTRYTYAAFTVCIPYIQKGGSRGMFEGLKLRNKVSDLEERVEKLERSMKQLLFDWDQTWEKMSRLNQRIAKRVKDAQNEAVAEPATEEEETGVSPQGTASSSVLNPHQQSMQAKILARRNAARPVNGG